jgi:hypothetical protein
VSRDFLLLVLFMNQFPPQPQSIPLRPFRIFSKIRGDIRSSRFATGVWQMEKIFNLKNFHNFVWSPFGSRRNIHINFCLQVNFQVSLFATGVVDTVANLLPVSLTPVANLPPVSTTQGELVAKFAAVVVDTGGKFAAGVVNTGGNSPPVSLIATGVVDTGGAP